MKKSQVATEFMLMVSLALVIVMMMIGVLNYLIYDYSEEKNIKRLTDLGYSLQNEFILAAQVEPGYERNITLPPDIEGTNYSVNITRNRIVLTYRASDPKKKIDLVFSIPEVTGTIDKPGSYMIMTTEHAITIN